MAELSSISYNSNAYVRMSWIMSTIWDQYMHQDAAKFDELNKLSKLSSISYKISSTSWMSLTVSSISWIS